MAGISTHTLAIVTLLVIMAGLMEIPGALFHATQATLATTVNQYVEPYLKEPSLGCLYLGLACLGLLSVPVPQAASLQPSVSISIASNVIVYVVVSFVATNTLPTGYDSVPIALVVLVALLAIVSPLSDACSEKGHIAGSIASNSRFVLASFLSKTILRFGDPTVSLLVAVALSLLEHLHALLGDPMMHKVLIMACVTVFKTLLLRSVPICLVIPTHILILSFAHPLIACGVFGMQETYEFILYQAGQDVANVAEATVGGLIGGMLACTLTLLAPTPVTKEVCQLAATSILSDLVLQTILQSAGSDPVLCLLTGSLALHLVVTLCMHALR